MDVIYWLIPSMIFVGVVLVALLIMGVKSGQPEPNLEHGWQP